MKTHAKFIATFLVGLLFVATQLPAQEVLPFPEPPSASTVGKTLKDSKHQWRTTPRRWIAWLIDSNRRELTIVHERKSNNGQENYCS